MPKNLKYLQRVEVKLTHAEHETLKEAAERSRIPLPVFLAQGALQVARTQHPSPLSWSQLGARYKAAEPNPGQTPGCGRSPYVGSLASVRQGTLNRQTSLTRAGKTYTNAFTFAIAPRNLYVKGAN